MPIARLPRFAWQFGTVQCHVPCAHDVGELTSVARAVLTRRAVPGAVVECGCFKGGSTARLSLACAATGRSLVVYDSFEGLPEPEQGDRQHEIQRPRAFEAGEYSGSLDEVRANVGTYGTLEVCDFVPGWFEDTMQSLPEEVAVAFIDVDLTESTRTVVTALWPRIANGGVLFVHDATDRKLADLLRDPALWGGAQPREAAYPTGSDTTLARFEK
jgi:O-methyltransferase